MTAIHLSGYPTDCLSYCPSALQLLQIHFDCKEIKMFVMEVHYTACFPMKNKFVEFFVDLQGTQKKSNLFHFLLLILFLRFNRF